MAAKERLRYVGGMKKHSCPPVRSASGHSLPPGYYWLCGIHPVQMALDNPARAKNILLGTANALARLKIPAKIQSRTVEGAELDKILPAQMTHQGVALAVQPLAPPPLEEILATGKPLLMLDQVTDPQNIGAIIRSAAAFGAAAVIVQDKHSPAENATIAKTAAGGLEVMLYLAVSNLSRCIEAAQKAGYWAVGMDGAATHTLAECKLSPKTLLVMGAEGAGLRRLVSEHCDMLAKLPISPAMESLNVSVAAGIALYCLL